jgi:hypothetical protein
MVSADSDHEPAMPDFERIAAVVFLFLGTLWLFGFVHTH